MDQKTRDTIALLGLIVTVIGVIAAIMVVPEFRRIFDLDPNPTQIIENTYSEQTYQVFPAPGWQDTNVMIGKGQKVTIDVTSGKWTNWVQGSPYNQGQGDGYVCGAVQCCEPLPDFPSAALIGKINSNIFGIGSNKSFTSEQNGTLYLRMNHCDSGDTSNSDGSLFVKIILER